MSALMEQLRAECAVIYTPGMERMLRRSRRAIYDMEKRGALPKSIRFSGPTGPKCWRLDEIEKWLAAGCPRQPQMAAASA